jgi:cell filamentation protein
VPGYTIDDRPDGVLKNKLGAATQNQLERLEAPLVAARYAELQFGHGPAGEFDAEHLKAIHHHLFQDVYEWAGHTRDERVTLSDKTIATEPLMRKQEGSNFLVGPSIPAALDHLATRVREADGLRGLSREDFAMRGADLMADLNAIHPFREGNGRTQRVFMEELAKQAGHTLDFSVVSRERMIQASIAANDRDDPAVMRRLFNEISDPQRAAALRQAIAALQEHGFSWNDRYLATIEPGHHVEIAMIGISRSGEHFMARNRSHILIGNTADLPRPVPERGATFTHVAGDHQHEQHQREAPREPPSVRQPQHDEDERDNGGNRRK